MQCGCLGGRVSAEGGVVVVVRVGVGWAGGGLHSWQGGDASAGRFPAASAHSWTLAAGSACSAGRPAAQLRRRARPTGLPAGVLRSTLQGHRGMIMAVRWNRKGDLLLSGAAASHASLPSLVAFSLPPPSLLSSPPPPCWALPGLSSSKNAVVWHPSGHAAPSSSPAVPPPSAAMPLWRPSHPNPARRRLARRHPDCVGCQGGLPEQAVRMPLCLGGRLRLAQQHDVCLLLPGRLHRCVQAVRRQAAAAVAGARGAAAGRCSHSGCAGLHLWLATCLPQPEPLPSASRCSLQLPPARPAPHPWRAVVPTRAVQGAHSADINSLRWEPNGKLLASCSDDGTVKVWQATAERPLHTLAGEA